MCLQLPEGTNVTDEDDPTGANAMARLAKILEENGMKEVDTVRLTARIPVVKFNCAKPLVGEGNEEEAYVDVVFKGVGVSGIIELFSASTSEGVDGGTR